MTQSVIRESMKSEFNPPDLSGSGISHLGRLIARPPARISGDEDILHALINPAWGGRPDSPATVFDAVHPGEPVCIVVSDQTRKTAVDRILPVLLAGLVARGCAVTDMCILFACGIHRHPTSEEVGRILGAAMATAFNGRIFMHDPDDNANLVTAGITRLGHDVRLNRRAFEARRLILTGTVTYHYHAGFGGGRKSIVPGLAGRQTIAHSHSLSLDLNINRFHPQVRAGSLSGNPVASEMLEGARMRAPDFIINTVLTPDNRLAGVFAGDMEAAHAAACRYAGSIYRCDISERADFVVASAASASNWIQAHKALYNADLAVKEDGQIVLFAPCPEGLGNERFRHWATRLTLDDLFAGLRTSPEVNGQTALSSRLRGARTILVTNMCSKDQTDLGIKTAPDLESAIRRTVSDLTAAGIKKPVYYTMPEALFTVPFIAGT